MFYLLTRFNPMLHFHIPWKRQKTSDYVMVLGGGEMEH